jgi:hypothetical protein
VQLLSEEAALDKTIYGTVNLSVCNIYAESDFSSEMMKRGLLVGMPVKVLQQNGWHCTQTPNKYISWVHQADITPMTKQKYHE